MRVKELVLGAARAAGGFALVRNSAWRNRRLMILCYHGVSMDDEHEWSPGLYITPARLRARLQALRDGGYAILPLIEAVRRLYDGTLPPRSVALTFDDGAVDFEVQALPILREFNAPATLYLTTYYSTKRLPVFNTVLGYVLWKGRKGNADVAPLINAPAPLYIGSDASRATARAALWEHAHEREMTADEKDAFVARVAEHIGVDYAAIKARGTLSLMSPDSVRALPRDLIDVQLHTHRHRTPRDRELFLREIRDNDVIIRELRPDGPALEHFCYPSGDYYGEFFDWLRECDVRYATTCLPDLASADSEPMLLPRFVDTMVASPLIFEAWITGFAALLPRKQEFRVDARRLATSGSG